MVFGALLFAIAAIITKKLIVTETDVLDHVLDEPDAVAAESGRAAIRRSSSSSTPR